MNTIEFKYMCKQFLEGFSLDKLRAYGREIGVDKPTKDKKKQVLIEEIVAVLAGEVAPQLPSLRGAPVKNDFVDPKIQEGIKRLRMMSASNGESEQLSEYKKNVQQLKKNPHVLMVEDPNADELRKKPERELYRGQLETLNGVSMLLPLNCMDSDKRVIISVDTIRMYDLREGDMISCYAEKRQTMMVATVILTVNDYMVDSFKRGEFDEKTVCYPKEQITFYNKEQGTTSGKMLQWLMPIGLGQRGLVLAPPKTGKTSLIADMHKSATLHNPGVWVYSLLIDQAPETVAYFRKIYGKENVLYTTYEDSPERQVFVADFILRRAKRMAECGLHVILLVDSLNALARAYNDTDASAGGKVLAGGMESKTVQYLKRYFGTARCFENGGSLTIVGALCTDTGNPADDILKSELMPIANLELCLSEELAKQRLFPAFDLLKSRGKLENALEGTKEDQLGRFIRNQYLPTFGWEGVLDLFKNYTKLRDLEESAIENMKKNHQ